MPDSTRTCKRCEITRPLTDFYIEAEARELARRGRAALRHCRYCQQEKMAARRAPRQALVDEAKRISGCVDCGLHPEILQVLEFDHREDEVKCFDVSDRMHRGPRPRNRKVRRRLRELPSDPHSQAQPVRS